MIKYFLDGAQIPSVRRPTYHRARAYPFKPGDVAFAQKEMERCVTKGYWTELFWEDMERPTEIVIGFVTRLAGKQRFVLDCRHP